MHRFFAALLVAGVVALLPAAATAQAPRLLTVVFKSATLPAQAVAIVEREGGTVVDTIPDIGVMSVRGPSSLITTLGRNTAVAAVSPTMLVRLPETDAMPIPKTFDTSGAAIFNFLQWDIKQVTNDGASFNVWPGTHSTVVALIDTGVNTKHQDLKGNLLGGRNFVPDGPGNSIVPDDIEDKNGHGSHVAGAVAGNGLILGVGPSLGFKAYRVFAATGGAPNTRIMAAMVAAANDGVDVISMSIGGTDALATVWWIDPETGVRYRLGSDVADFVAYRRAVAYANSRGIVVVAAAGNEALNIANPSMVTAYLNSQYGDQGYVFQGASRITPGTLTGVVTVSATGPDQSLASYSDYGPGAIDVAAPGGDSKRYPAMTPTPWFYDYCAGAYMAVPGFVEDSYGWMAGTSMATPKVAAVAALIIDKAKAAGLKLTPQQVVTAIQRTAVDIGKPGQDPFFGSGLVNAYNAVVR